MARFHKDSLRFRIMNYIFYCGIIPVRALNLLKGEKEGVLKMVRQMRRDNWLTLNVGDERKFLTATPYFDGYEEYEDYFFGDYRYWHDRIKHSNYKLDDSATSRRKMQRLSKISETSIFTNENGIQALPESKIPIHLQSIYWFAPTFYNSLEIKDEMSSEEARASASRSTGLICWNNEAAAVFSLGDDTIKIGEITEKLYVERISRLMANKVKDFQLNEAYLFTWKYEKVHKKLELFKNYGSFFYLDDTYKSFYLIPYSKEGGRLLKLMFSKYAKEELMNMIIRPSWRTKMMTMEIEADGKDENDIYLFNYLIPDISRFKKFVRAAQVLKDAQFHIYCYDFQEEAVKNEITDNVTYNTYSLDAVEQMYLKRIERRDRG